MAVVNTKEGECGGFFLETDEEREKRRKRYGGVNLMPCPWKNLEEKEEEGTRQKSHQILECSSGNTRTLEPEYSNN